MGVGYEKDWGRDIERIGKTQYNIIVKVWEFSRKRRFPK